MHSALQVALFAVLVPLGQFASGGMAATSAARLAGQRVLATGAGRGIGRAIALLCHREGARVAITSRTRAELEETASLTSTAQDTRDSCSEAIPPSAVADEGTSMHVHVADVIRQDQVDALVADMTEMWGGIDVLVNNAGGAQSAKGPSETMDSNDLGRLLDLNVVAVHRVTSAVLRQAMLPAGSGRIVNVSSRAGKVGFPNMSFYVASKFALEGITASLSEELKDKNIQINTLSPGMVDTKSFPNRDGQPGVRTAESLEDAFFLLLESGGTGNYLHVDELDEARAKGMDDTAALKPIREPRFSP